MELLRLRILLGSNSEKSAIQLKSFLIESGYEVLDVIPEGYELLRRIRTFEPDIVMLDYKLHHISGLEVARTILEDEICPVILIGSETELSFAYELEVNHNFLCLSRPLNRQVILYTIDLIVKNDRKIKALKKQLDAAQRKIEAKTIVDKAKRALMKEKGLTEEEAYRKLQKQSMDQGMQMVEVAKAILIAYS